MMKKITSICFLAAVSVVSATFALSQPLELNCQPIFTKGGAQLPVGCEAIGVPLSETMVGQPTIIDNGLIEGEVVEVPTVLQPLEPIQPIAPVPLVVLDPVENTAETDALELEPVEAMPFQNNYAGAGIGAGAALLGESFLYNGVGGTTSDSTFGSKLAGGQTMYNINGSAVARFSTFFAQASGFYSQGKDSWTDTAATFRAVDGADYAKATDSLVDFDGNIYRATAAGGYTFDVGNRVGLNVGPSVTFSQQNFTAKITDETLTLEDKTTVNSVYFGAMAGVSLAPDMSQDLVYWGGANAHVYYGLGSYTTSQTINGGTALTQAAATGKKVNDHTIAFMGEADVNVGYEISDGLHIGGGAFGNYLSQVGVLKDYNISPTSLMDFGAKASLSVGF